MKVNKNDVIKEVAEELQLPVSTVKTIVNSVISSIENHIVAGNEVSIKGLVHFYHKKFGQKEVHDFATDQRVKMEPRTLPISEISRAIIDKYRKK